MADITPIKVDLDNKSNTSMTEPIMDIDDDANNATEKKNIPEFEMTA